MIISVKWNDKNSTFKIGEYTFKQGICQSIFLTLIGRCLHKK